MGSSARRREATWTACQPGPNHQGRRRRRDRFLCLELRPVGERYCFFIDLIVTTKYLFNYATLAKILSAEYTFGTWQCTNVHPDTTIKMLEYINLYILLYIIYILIFIIFWIIVKFQYKVRKKNSCTENNSKEFKTNTDVIQICKNKTKQKIWKKNTREKLERIK